jgi:hypothetical protein
MPTEPEPGYSLAQASFYESECGSLIHRLFGSGASPTAQSHPFPCHAVYETTCHSARNLNQPQTSKSGLLGNAQARPPRPRTS